MNAVGFPTARRIGRRALHSTRRGTPSCLAWCVTFKERVK